MPKGFSNIAVKCDGRNRVYATDHGDSYSSSVAVSPNDPACGGASRTEAAPTVTTP
jgi:hypothetical protein